jgi:hypothetical protein
MSEQIVQILERKDPSSVWVIRTVIQVWPNIPQERARLKRFLDAMPEDPSCQ